MKTPRLFLLLAALATAALAADPSPTPAETASAEPPALSAKQLERIKLASSIKLQTGEITLPGGLAKLNLAADQNYLSPEDTATVLYKIWGNPDGGAKPLGMIVPAGFTPFKSGWAVIIDYTDDGHVPDSDASKIDYADLLKNMQKGAQEANEERVKQGYEPVQLIGWATAPHYDASTHKLYWAKNLKFGDSKENTLNYNIRVLGRVGYLELNVVADLADLPAVEKATPKILSSVDFLPGNRYADFKEGTDKVATYGIAALVAGGIAAKAGFFKVIWLAILAGKKFILMGVIAIGAWIKKLIGARKDA